MALLDFLAKYESVQLLMILCIGVAVLAYIIGYNWRKQIVAKDVHEQHEHQRKIELHNVKHADRLEGRSDAEEVD